MDTAPDFAEPVIGRAFARPVGSIRATLSLIVELESLFLQLHYYQDAFSLFWRQVWQPAHTLGVKRVGARERAALFTDLPQMRVELSWGH
ncbi:hypothetical protein V1294_004684 [Bradyrhizobium sp. AZCC 1678]|uniref:hypothetical protein n=1 Tax=Bradyrhizobium sp. AZCC 1678 TaxID=3117030 RepID=UPI002FEEFFEF